MRRSLFAALVGAAACFSPTARGAVELPSVLGSGMVLQRDLPVPIWGWADPGEQVTVTFAGQTASASADKEGRWKVTLPALKACAQGQTLTVCGSNTLTLTDVLVGEVWVGAGQSNMEWQVDWAGRREQTLVSANRPAIRLFQLPHVEDEKPQQRPRGAWVACSPKTVATFSAVLFHFGLRLQDDLQVPVGLINSSQGATMIEQWAVPDEDGGATYDRLLAPMLYRRLGLANTPIRGTLYRGKIAPLQPFAIRGVLWYQGEGNVHNGFAYHHQQAAMIHAWRRTWGRDFPFYFVQIAPYSSYFPHLAPLVPSFWEGQAATLKIPGTGMVVVTDAVHDVADIHPQDKAIVGNRLALWALAKTYGRRLVYSGPMYKGMEIEDDKVCLRFAHTGSGLAARDGRPLREFEVAGADGRFVPARAVLDGDVVLVWAKGVANPTQVRFGWSAVANPNLMNKEGLPAAPFQTNGWRGGTGE